VRPSIEVTVAGGQTVMVTVKNQGPAFNLVMQLTYVRATFPLNSTASHKFASRRLNANGTVRFQIMRVTPARELALYADTLRVLQTRDVSYGAPDVEAHLAFVAEDGESPGILSEYSLYVSLPSVTVRTEFAVNLVQLF
jgi:hypothetical protein